MPNKIDKCCADCGHLDKRNYCDRYNLFMLGADLKQCTCECFATSEELAEAAAELEAFCHSDE